MSQVTSIDQEKTKHYDGLRLPIDPLIEFTANQVASRISKVKAREVVRFLRFACVGLLGAIIDLGVSNILFVTVLPPTDSLGDPVLINTLIAASISFTVAILSNFFWNRYWTYPDSRTRPLGQQLILFAFICTVGWIGRTIWLSFATAPLTDFVTNNTALSVDLAGRAGASFAIFLGIFVVMIWNFVVNRLWTFNDVD